MEYSAKCSVFSTRTGRNEKMVRKAKIIPRQLNEKIHISAFKDIHVHFQGDVYLLATWMAKSDLAKSTPTQQHHTTLRGLAGRFSTLYGIDYTKPLNVEDILDIFRSFGITGNPQLTLENPERYTDSQMIIEITHTPGLEAKEKDK